MARPMPRWLTVHQAAAFLSLSPEALRKALERRVFRALDGGIEAELDGVRGRKFGRLWRVSLAERWTAELFEGGSRSARHGTAAVIKSVLRDCDGDGRGGPLP